MYEKSCEIIYRMIAQRIKVKRNILKLKNTQILPSDPNLVSAILKNRKVAKKNKYLIPSGVQGSNETDSIKIISQNLQFSSVQELILGSREEIDLYSGFLFRQLIIDTVNNSDDEKTSDMMSEILSDYVPYAVADIYWSTIQKHGDIAKFYLDTCLKTDIENAVIELDNAIARLYPKYKNDFDKMLIGLFEEREDTYKLNKRFSELMKKKLIPFMKKDMTAYSFGIDAREIILRRYDQLISFEKNERSISPETLFYHSDDFDYEYEEKMINTREIYNKITKVVSKESEFIRELAKLQLQLEPQPDIDIIMDKWDYMLFI